VDAILTFCAFREIGASRKFWRPAGHESPLAIEESEGAVFDNCIGKAFGYLQYAARGGSA